MSAETKSLILNAVLFQLTWFACVLGAAWQAPLLGPGMGLLVGVCGHLALSADRRRQLWVVALVGVFGTVLETINGLVGVWVPVHPQPWLGLAPAWMIVLWMGFATTLDYSLSWFKSRLPLAAVAGVVFGPVAFWAGERLGAVTLAPGYGIPVLALEWGLAMPLLYAVVRRLRLPTAETFVLFGR